VDDSKKITLQKIDSECIAFFIRDQVSTGNVFSDKTQIQSLNQIAVSISEIIKYFRHFLHFTYIFHSIPKKAEKSI